MLITSKLILYYTSGFGLFRSVSSTRTTGDCISIFSCVYSFAVRPSFPNAFYNRALVTLRAPNVDEFTKIAKSEVMPRAEQYDTDIF